jgi:quercetin dioxygenase-like cupin family protein
MSEMRLLRGSDVPLSSPPLHHGVDLRTLFQRKGRLTFGLVRMEAGGYAEAHAHARSEHVIYVLEGRLAVTAGEAPPVVLEPGTAVHVPAELPHATKSTGGQACAYIIVTAPPADEED